MSDKVFYKGLVKLTSSEPELNKGDDIKMCLYSISTKEDGDTYKPFLEFLLYREDNTLSFPIIKYSTNTPSNLCISILKKMFSSNKVIEYKGYIDDVLFFEMKQLYNYPPYKKSDELLWFVNVDEIINYRRSLHFVIDNTITNLFLKNSELIYLIDEQNNTLETPVTAYYGKSMNKIKPVSIFGVDKANYNASLGPFYYFGTITRAIRYSCWSADYKERKIHNTSISDKNGKYNEGGLVKFVIFVGSANMTIKRKNDKKSGFEKTVKSVSDNSYSGFDTTVEKDKLWVDMFDTIIIDRTTNMEECQYVVRDMDNQIPLAYYTINTSNVARDRLHEITID
tara:strand:- start:1309 stop:2325 length:1017 start_codon:yes stop_codon:yes gene_type:complete